MKKVMKDLNVFRRNFRGIQDVGGKIQTIIYLIKDELQNYIENSISL